MKPNVSFFSVRAHTRQTESQEPAESEDGRLNWLD